MPQAIPVKTISDIERIVKQMSLDEKIAQLFGLWLELEEDGSGKAINLDDGQADKHGNEQIPRDVDELIRHGLGQITRPLGTRPVKPGVGLRALNAFQKKVIASSRFGIPVLSHEECLPGAMVEGATGFPSALNYGATWQPDLVQKVARCISSELQAVGAKLGLSPVLDVARDARWGRTEETFSEDPYHIGLMASAYIRGLQGDQAEDISNSPRPLLATLKHFAGHSFSEGARNHAPVNLGPREMADTFLLPFEMAVRLSHPGALMPAYHDVDGEPLSASRHYLHEVLREQWGFDGILVSDYMAIAQLHTQHRIAGCRAEACAAALKAGMDVELPNPSYFYFGLREALERSLIGMDEIDLAVRRHLLAKLELGLFAQPYVDEQQWQRELRRPEHLEAAEELAANSFVLLQNDGILPLDAQSAAKIALIGECAGEPLSLFCGYSFPVHHLHLGRSGIPIEHSAECLQQVLDQYLAKAEIEYQLGAPILQEGRADGNVFPSEDVMKLEIESVQSSDKSHIAAAVAAAARAELVVLNLGDRSGLFRQGTVAEGSDASSLKLPAQQEELLRQVLAQCANDGTKCILILQCGRPYVIPAELLRQLAAVLLVWLPGERGAHAIAKTLVGINNPSGRLNVSFPKSTGAVPFFYNHKMKSAGMPIQEDFGARFCFGHGLSYSRFDYSNLQLHSSSVPSNGTIKFSFGLENRSECSGAEVPQVYVRDLTASVARPNMELKAFQKIYLDAAEQCQVCIEIPVDMLNLSVLEGGRTKRVVEAGEFLLMLGRSCEDILFQEKITVTGPAQRVLGREWQMQARVRVD